MQEDLNQAYDVGIAKGIWKPVTFNEYDTPVVPVRKQSQPNQSSGAVRVCGDYSVFSNGQLETHRQPMPLPEDLMRRLDGTHYFSKVDLADAYNQIELGPERSRPEPTQRGPSSEAASIWHQLRYRVLRRCHEPAHK